MNSLMQQITQIFVIPSLKGEESTRSTACLQSKIRGMPRLLGMTISDNFR